MKRARIPQILLLALLASAAVWAAPAANQRAGAAPATVSGVYAVTFSIDPGSAIAAGGAILCKARITPNLPAFENMNRGVAPVESAPAVVTVGGSAPVASPVLCSVEIPFAWPVSDRAGGVALSYEIDAVRGSGVAAVRTGQGIAVAYPETGGTASVRLNVTF
jgi:hypothetical protein